ncbi:glyoxalase superfamily protein [Rhodobacteraceae bacterium D3-12]|nr:glyoxalase superfamily protein [Rhodobacteraceae bacterium D3-12]
MTDFIPSPDGLKTLAKRLREAMAYAGTPLSHSEALETVARQHGFRDWNTAQASAKRQNPAPRWQIGQAVTGRYLGHAFTARIKSATESTGGFWRLTLVFDQPVDVVASKAFSNFRRQVSCVINGQGVTHERTSDGTPHMVLFAT